MGSSCARLVVTPQPQIDGFSQVIAPLDSQIVRFTGTVTAEGPNVRAWLRIECLNPNIDSEEAEYGQLAESDSDACPLNGEWTQISASIKIPPQTTHIRVFACVEGTDGHASFDDFVIEREN